jgi:hypothetical protein
MRSTAWEWALMKWILWIRHSPWRSSREALDGLTIHEIMIYSRPNPQRQATNDRQQTSNSALLVMILKESISHSIQGFLEV